MNVTYDPKMDILTIDLAPGTVAESNREKPGIILDYDAEGNLMGLEILDASQCIPDVTSVHLRIAG